MLTLPSALRRAVRILLPVECSSCGTSLTDDPVPFFCRGCWQRIEPFRGPSCPCCHQPFVSPVTLLHSPHHLCGQCRHRRPAYTEAWSLYPYTPPLQDAICLFKYQRKVALAGSLTALMRQALPDGLMADLIMPVPLHPTRLRQREFNQSLLLADGLSTVLKIPLSYTNLVLLYETESQTALRRADRLKNLRKAFGLLAPSEVKGKRVLLIDDVYTTGTTVNECAKVLRKAGADHVYALTLARTVGGDLVPDHVYQAQNAPAMETHRN
ncbi:MAG: ComF family protein [Nitrospiraceae bacterium]